MPKEFVGTLKVRAFVSQEPGNNRQGLSTDLALKVKAPAPLVGIKISEETLCIFEFEPDKFRTFDVLGIYADGVERILNPVDFPMQAMTENIDIARVDSYVHPKSKATSRIVKGVQFGTTVLKVTDGTHHASATVMYRQ